MPAARVVVVDASLNAPRIASELRRRGRNAIAAQQLALATGVKDPEVLRGVFSRFEDPVLVTADDRMPLTHAAVVDETRATIAVVDPWDRNQGLVRPYQPDGSEQEAYERDVIHRWVHTIQSRDTGTVYRYFLTSGGRPWTARLR